MIRRAKIVATVGPASQRPEDLRAIVLAGAEVLRLNLSHGSHDWHRETIATIRAVAEEEQRHLAILLDLMGPRYRLANLPKRRCLEAGERVRLGLSADADLPLGEAEVLAALSPGQRLLIDQGLVDLVIEETSADEAVARVLTGGEVSSRKGINLPDSDLGFAITTKDHQDIAFAVEQGVDYLAASYVGRAADLTALEDRIAAAGGSIPLVAKLERKQAVEHLEEIVEAATAVMVARGDLGVEVPIHQVPVLQKKIVRACRERATPVIVATQMLESMMAQPRPTRAEATDIANAIFDGADALMLSGETAAGKYPRAAVEVMARTIVEAEDYRRQVLHDRINLRRSPARSSSESGVPRLSEDIAQDIPDMVCGAAVYTAGELAAELMVAFTQTGFTGLLISRYRPSTRCVVFTNSLTVARQLNLVWGVEPHFLPDRLEHHDEVIQLVDRELLTRRLATPGTTIVALMADPIRERARTNLMRVHQVRTAEQWRAAEQGPPRRGQP
ncbi:MAG: pyruvate kinase [Acidobacteriota bacterium]